MKKIFLILLALAAVSFAGAQDSESDFFSEPTVTQDKPTTVDPTAQFTQGLQWGGSLKSGGSWTGGWKGGTPVFSDLSSGYYDSLGFDLASTVALDSRPNKDFRFRLALKTGYPFASSTVFNTSAISGATKPTTLTLNNLKVWEFFSDVTLYDTLFLRFGKQSASMGVSYFYSPGDLLSLTAKDPLDPTADREGPLALKMSVPLPNYKATLYSYAIAREDYFAAADPRLLYLGYVYGGDILVGEAQLGLAGFYQYNMAPKAVGTINTGLSFIDLPVVRDLNVFSEQIVSWGSDKRIGSGSATIPNVGTVFANVSKPSDLNYSATAGVSYSNSDNNYSVRVEYFYNGLGSSEKDYTQRAYYTYAYSQAGATGIYSNFGFSDISNPGIHNVTELVSFSKINNSKFGLSVFSQQNLSDMSGWIYPKVTFDPTDYLDLYAAVGYVWGEDSTQFALQNIDLKSFQTKRVWLTLGFTLGGSRY